MLKWLFDMAVGRLATEKDDDVDYDKISGNDDTMMIDLILYDVEAIVFAFETERELHKSRECLRNRVPDYSWLVTDTSQKPKKYLTLSERSRLQRACERIRPEEWSKLINLWKARSKVCQ
uniref:Sin3a_C domain-containing protein n=1 Tax=Angiostrongylus cantonensis TaxID=6313 RepID=A0A0K0DD10_ANGCA